MNQFLPGCHFTNSRKNLPAGKKSYAISITLQDDEKTLQDKQIDSAMERIVASLRKKLGAELR